MNIYLDIDGVLLHDGLSDNGRPANGARELLEIVTSKHDCFWLTSHCCGGENRAVEYLKNTFPESLLDKIKPTNWSSWKTEAIDFGSDFVWLDDDAYLPEYERLDKHGSRDKLILVNLRANPEQLSEIIRTLR